MDWTVKCDKENALEFDTKEIVSILKTSNERLLESLEELSSKSARIIGRHSSNIVPICHSLMIWDTSFALSISPMVLDNYDAVKS